MLRSSSAPPPPPPPVMASALLCKPSSGVRPVPYEGTHHDEQYPAAVMAVSASRRWRRRRPGHPPGAADTAPTYVNAVVVSTDVGRVPAVTVRRRRARRRRLRIEGALAPRLGRLKPGDSVIVTLRFGRVIDIRLAPGPRPGPLTPSPRAGRAHAARTADALSGDPRRAPAPRSAATPGPTPTPTANPGGLRAPVPTPRPVPYPEEVFPSPEFTVPPSPGPSPTPTPSPR